MIKADLKKKKIAVLMGGKSGEREISLRSGKNVLNSLRSQGFNAVSVDPDDKLIEKLKKDKIEVAFIVLHGKFGEDGAIQGLLELSGIPYTGSKVLASALAMNKLASKRIFESAGLPTPKFLPIDPNADISKEIEKIKRVFPFPLVIKPVSEGSSLGIEIIKNPEELDKPLKKIFAEYKDVFIEEFISGQEVTVGIIGKGEETQALPVLELCPKNEFYDYHAKYTAGQTEFILPARLTKDLYEHVQKTALDAHNSLGCCGVSRVDMIVSKDHVPYINEVNTIPGMTDQSDLPAEAKHAGISFDELVVKILESAF